LKKFIFYCSKWQAGINKPRYANMRGILQAKKKPQQQVLITELMSDDFQSSLCCQKLYFPEKQKNTEWIEGNADVVAESLLKKIKWID